MLTPSFEIDQHADFVIVSIHVPYIKISEAEFDISGNEFKFFCKPYFLRLHLPGELVEDGREKACYDVDHGVIVVYLPKQNSGEHFENLGMITSLLSPKKPVGDLLKIGRSPLIETVSGEECAAITEEEEDDFDWQMEQQIPNEEEEAMKLKGLPAYGFAEQHKGVFSKLQEEIPSIVDCPDPDHMTSHERRVGRIAHEESSFDPEYYLADLMDSDLIKSLLLFEAPWKKELQQWTTKQKQAQSSAAEETMVQFEPDRDIVPFADHEIQQLKDLPNKEFLLDKAMRRILYLGLVDIIFAFAYNYRSTEGEDNVESAWTVCKISSTLSWLEVFRGGVHEVIYCCLRRALCYPLYRHWELAVTVLQDTKDLFKLGRRKLLQCLLSMRQILNSCEPSYILNNLYITDYCIWIQKASAKQIQKLASELNEVSVAISSIGWDLLELEKAAKMVLTEEGQELHDDTATDDEAVAGEQEVVKTRVESSCSSVSSSDLEEESDGSSDSSSCSGSHKDTSCGGQSECSLGKPSITEMKDDVKLQTSHQDGSSASSSCNESPKDTSCGGQSECSLGIPSITEMKDDVKLQTSHQDSDSDLCRNLHDMKLHESNCQS